MSSQCGDAPMFKELALINKRLYESELITTNKRLYASGKYSDLTIRCHGQVFPVHRSVVCLRSDVFEAMVDEEASTSEIDLPNDDPHIVKLMLDFIYTSEYSDGRKVEEPGYQRSTPKKGLKARRGNRLRRDEPDDFRFAAATWPDREIPAPKPEPPEPEPASTESEASSALAGLGSQFPVTSGDENEDRPRPDHYEPLSTNAKLYVMADVYNLPTLKTLASEKFEAALKTHSGDLQSFFDTIAYVWKNTLETDRGLRDVIIQFICSNMAQLLDEERFANLIKSDGEVAWSILSYQPVVKKPNGWSESDVVW